VLGDMLELGAAAEDLHEQTGRRIADLKIDLLIGVGPLGRYIAKGAADGSCATRTFDDVAPTAEFLSEYLEDGDTVLLKGSRALRLERLVDPLKARFTGGCSRSL